MPSRFQLPPIVKAAERLLVDIENAVRRFPRYHRYQIGADLRTQAMSVYRVASRAWRDRAHQRRWVEQLVWAVDELKQYMQTAKLLHAFTSVIEKIRKAFVEPVRVTIVVRRNENDGIAALYGDDNIDQVIADMQAKRNAFLDAQAVELGKRTAAEAL